MLNLLPFVRRRMLRALSTIFGRKSSGEHMMGRMALARELGRRGRGEGQTALVEAGWARQCHLCYELGDGSSSQPLARTIQYMGTDAFIDTGFAAGKDFCDKFLLSNEFRADQLKDICPESKSNSKGKSSAALAELIANGNRDDIATLVMTSFVTQPRPWLSLRFGEKANDISAIKVNGKAEDLLTSFGQAGWYGPITVTSDSSEKRFYIRVVPVPYRMPMSTKDNPGGMVRWHVIAEVGRTYLALHWRGFTGTKAEETIVMGQFEYWKYIPVMFDELEDLLGGTWTQPDLYELILGKLWDTYVEDPAYRWVDRRIRSDTDKVVFTAHSSDPDDDDDDENDENDSDGRAIQQMRGLKAFSDRLAKSALVGVKRALGTGFNDGKYLEVFKSAELELRRGLINGVGTKSYEFSLTKKRAGEISETRLFRGHCYFGNSSSPYNKQTRAHIFGARGHLPDGTLDSLQHLKCYKKYGNSTQSLKFLIEQLS